MAAGATASKMKDGIRRHGDGWQARVYAGKKDGRKQYIAKVFRTKKQAEAWRDARRDEYHKDGEVFEPTKLTVEEYLHQWLAAAEQRLSPATINDYEVAVRVHIVPAIGAVPLARVTVTKLGEFYADAAKTKTTRVMRSVHYVLSAALNRAMKQGLIRQNPCALVDAPKHTPKEMRPLSPEEAERLLRVAEPDRLYPLWLLGMTTGLRRGELCGLRWADVNLDAGVLGVRQQLVVVRGHNVFKEPKTKASRAAVRLLPEVVEALRSHRVRQTEEQLAAEVWQDHGLVFCLRDGKPLHPNNLLKRDFRGLLAKAGLPATVRIHDLRHTVATLLLARGTNLKVASALLRHSRTSTTLDIYAHVLPGMAEQGVAALREVLPSRGRRQKAEVG